MSGSFPDETAVTLPKTLRDSTKRLSRDQVGRVYDLYAPLLFFMTRRFKLSDEVGDEIVQEAFLRLARQPEPMSDLACKGFLVIACRNLIIDERKKLRPVPVAEVPSPAKGAWGADDWPGTIAEGRLSRVAEAWKALKSTTDFEVFEDYYQIGWNTEEIAKRRQMPAGTVRSKIHRLREKFRLLLDRS